MKNAMLAIGSSRAVPRWVATLTGALGAWLLATASVAQEDPAKGFPAKPLRIIVGYSTGGGNDIVARLISGKITEGLGQPVIVENKPGAQSIIAAEYVAKASADGYTLLMGPSGPMTMNPATYSKLPYSPLRDFAPITMIGSFPLILVANPALPVRSVKELVEYAKQHQTKVYYASSAAPFQLATELFNQRTGTAFAHVPYKGSGDSVKAVMSGEVTITITDPPPVAGPLKGGQVRPLAITTAARHPGWPEIPTMAEAGLQDMEITIWMGLFAPAATPPGIVRKLYEEVARVVRLPDIRARFTGLGIDPSGMPSEELGRVVAADIARWTAVAKAANIRADK